MGKVSYLNTEIRVSVNSQAAVNGLQELFKSAENIRQKLKEMEAGGITDANKNEYNQLVKDLNKVEAAAKRLARETLDMGEVMNDLSGQKLKTLRQALKKTKKEMEDLDPKKFTGLREYNQEMDRLRLQAQTIERQIGSVTGEFEKQDNVIANTIKRLTSYVLVYSGFNFVKNQLSSMVQKNLEFSDSLADIRKTTGLSTKTVTELSNAINTIDTRTSVQELHELAHVAGRLGIGGGGADAVLGFVRAANQINVALGEDLGQDAIVQLAKMNDVMGNTATMGVEKALLATGSAINLLAQSSTASGQFMSDYAMRLSGIATQAHMTTAELLGLAAASDATGQEVEVSATAMNKFVVQLQTHYKTVAKAAGVNEQMLHDMLTMGKTTDAVVMVLEALSEKGGLSMLAPLMKDLGSDGARLTASLSTLASNIGIVKDQLNLAREAFAEGTSVTNEYNIKNETAAAIMQRMANSWEKMFVNAQQSGVLKELVKDIYDLSNSLQQSSFFMGVVGAAMRSLVSVVQLLIKLAPALAIAYSVSGLLNFTRTLVTRYIPAMWQAITALRTFAGVKAALFSGGWALAIGAVVGLTTVLVHSATAMTNAEKSAKRLSDGFKDFQKKAFSAQTQADYFFRKLKEAEPGSKTHKELIKKINDEYGQYLPNLLDEKSKLEDIATAQKAVNEQLRQSIALKVRNEAISSEQADYMSKQAELYGDIQSRFDRLGLSDVGSTVMNEVSAKMRQMIEEGKTVTEAYNAAQSIIYGEYSDSAHQEAAAKARARGDFDPISKSNFVSYTASGAAIKSALEESGRPAGDMFNIFDTLLLNLAKSIEDENQAIVNIHKKYDPIINGYTPKVEPTPNYTIVEDEKEKQKKANREALAWARDEYKAVTASIAVYYEQQQQVLNEMRLKGQLTATQYEQQTQAFSSAQTGTEVKARAALHGDPGAQSEWTAEVQRMELETIANTERNSAALQNLREKDLKQIGDKLRLFGEAQDDGIWKQLEEGKSKLTKEEIKMAEEVQAILLKYDFTGKVTDQYIAAMEKLQLISPQLTEEMEKSGKTAMDIARQGMSELYAVYPKMFDIDINTEEGLAQFRGLVTGTEGLTKELLVSLDDASDEGRRLLTDMFPKFADITDEQLAEIDLFADEGVEKLRALLVDGGAFAEDFLSLEADSLKLLYYQALEYGDAMVEAEKKARQRNQKIADERWRQMGGKEREAGYDRKESQIEETTSLFSRVGLASDNVATDMEVELYKARMDAAIQARDVAIQCNGDIEEANARVAESINNLSNVLVEKTMSQLETLKSFMDPLEDFGSALGEAWATDDAIEKQEALRKATQEFVKELGDATKEMIVNWVKQKIQHAITKRAMAATEKASQKEMTGAVDAGQKAEQTLVEQGQKAITDAVTDFGNQAVAAKKAQTAESVSDEAAKASAKVPLGIAEGAANTIGELGWWGIPLVAVITALLNGLLSAAMSKVGSLFGGGSSKASAATSTKLVTGMLTYDSGNVQQVLGSDGRIYQAQVGGIHGSGLVTVPTLTNVNGQTALVGERGPELVIGRETTRMMMENAPELLASLVQFDKLYSGRGFRTYDTGNLSTFASVGSRNSDDAEQAIMERILTAVNTALAPTLANVGAAMEANARAQQTLVNRLNQPMSAQINKRQLIDEVADGLLTDKRTGRNKNVTRLFG